MKSAKVPDWNVKFKIVPSLLGIMSGKQKINQIRNVAIEDLLTHSTITLTDTHIH